RELRCGSWAATGSPSWRFLLLSSLSVVSRQRREERDSSARRGRGTQEGTSYPYLNRPFRVPVESATQEGFRSRPISVDLVLVLFGLLAVFDDVAFAEEDVLQCDAQLRRPSGEDPDQIEV